jgi:hypothetical protein
MIQLVAAALVVAVGCRSDHSRAHTDPSGVPLSAQSLPNAQATGAARVTTSCTHERTASIGFYSDSGQLQNVRVAANSDGALLTWERLDLPSTGDTSQLGFGATTNANADLETVVLPARAYAAAAYTTVAPSMIEGHLDFVTYGVAGGSGFDAYSAGIAAWKGIKVFEDLGPKAWVSKVLPFMLTEALVAAPNVPLAVIGGIETPCANRYDCVERFESLERRGFPKSLRSLSFLGKQAHSEILFKGTILAPKKTFAPSVAVLVDRGLVSYRVDDQLKAQWMTLDGKLDGEAIVVGPSGDIGAPTLGFGGEHAFVVWAYRTQKKDTYRLWIARVAKGLVDFVRPLETGTSDAFAPAIAERGDSLVMVWMQGDGGKKGTIRLGRIALGDIVAERAEVQVRAIEPLTPDDGNRRDPEIAVSGNHVYVTWSDFTSRRTGIPVLRILSCKSP